MEKVLASAIISVPSDPQVSGLHGTSTPPPFKRSDTTSGSVLFNSKPIPGPGFEAPIPRFVAANALRATSDDTMRVPLIFPGATQEIPRRNDAFPIHSAPAPISPHLTTRYATSTSDLLAKYSSPPPPSCSRPFTAPPPQYSHLPSAPSPPPLRPGGPTPSSAAPPPFTQPLTPHAARILERGLHSLSHPSPPHPDPLRASPTTTATASTASLAHLKTTPTDSQRARGRDEDHLRATVQSTYPPPKPHNTPPPPPLRPFTSPHRYPPNDISILAKPPISLADPTSHCPTAPPPPLHPLPFRAPLSPPICDARQANAFHDCGSSPPRPLLWNPSPLPTHPPARPPALPSSLAPRLPPSGCEGLTVGPWRRRRRSRSRSRDHTESSSSPSPSLSVMSLSRSDHPTLSRPPPKKAEQGWSSRDGGLIDTTPSPTRSPTLNTPSPSPNRPPPSTYPRGDDEPSSVLRTQPYKPTVAAPSSSTSVPPTSAHSSFSLDLAVRALRDPMPSSETATRRLGVGSGSEAFVSPQRGVLRVPRQSHGGQPTDVATPHHPPSDLGSPTRLQVVGGRTNATAPIPSRRTASSSPQRPVPTGASRPMSPHSPSPLRMYTAQARRPLLEVQSEGMGGRSARGSGGAYQLSTSRSGPGGATPSPTHSPAAAEFCHELGVATVDAAVDDVGHARQRGCVVKYVAPAGAAAAAQVAVGDIIVALGGAEVRCSEDLRGTVAAIRRRIQRTGEASRVRLVLKREVPGGSHSPRLERVECAIIFGKAGEGSVGVSGATLPLRSTRL